MIESNRLVIDSVHEEIVIKDNLENESIITHPRTTVLYDIQSMHGPNFILFSFDRSPNVN